MSTKLYEVQKDCIVADANSFPIELSVGALLVIRTIGQDQVASINSNQSDDSLFAGKYEEIFKVYQRDFDAKTIVRLGK